MERCALVFRLAIDVRSKLSENLDHLHMTLITRHMQRCPAIRITFVEECLSQLRILLNQELVASLVVAFLCVDPYISQKSPLLLLVLFSL